MANDGWKDIQGEGLSQQLDQMVNETNQSFDGIVDTHELEEPVFVDIEEINSASSNTATDITQKLSQYFFDEKYIEKHPYVKTKIAQEMENVRRLLKILKVNETAQDFLIKSICKTPSKGTLYSALSGIESTMLSVQKQLEEHIKQLEDMFSAMNAECEKTFEEKDKEVADDGSMVSRGSKDFLKSLQEQLNKKMVNEQ